jgi:hypothetical protein
MFRAILASPLAKKMRRAKTVRLDVKSGNAPVVECSRTLTISGLREVVWVILGSDAAERRTSAGSHGFGGVANLGAFFRAKLSCS